MEHFGTIFKFFKEENYDKFVSSLSHLSEEARAGFKNGATSETLIKNDNGTFTHIDYFPDRELKVDFTPDVEQEVPAGSKSLKILFSFEGSALVQKLTEESNSIFIKRQPIDDSTLKVTFSTNYSDVVGARYFKK